MSKRFLRLIDILALLPRSGSAISTAAVHEKILHKNHPCSKRTIERDLCFLADALPNAIERIPHYPDPEMHDDGREEDRQIIHNAWRLINRRGVIPENLLDDENITLALTLLKQQAFNRLPRSLYNDLGTLWKQASAKASHHNAARQWMQQILPLPDPLRAAGPCDR